MNTEMAQKPRTAQKPGTAQKPRAMTDQDETDPKRTETSPPAEKVVEKLQPLAGERQLGESDNAVLCFNDWLRLGKGRTLHRLLAYYRAKRSTEFDRIRPPQSSTVENRSNFETTIGSLKHWSATFGWQERAHLFDRQLDELHTAHRSRVMEEGFALDYVRIAALKRLAARLQREIHEQGIFLIIEQVDDKGRSSSEEKYNSALVNDYLKVLADIAKERGHRHRNSYLDTLVAQVERELDADKINLAQMGRMARGEHFISVLLEPYLKTE